MVGSSVHLLYGCDEMTDIVEQLRDTYPKTYPFTAQPHMVHEAADEIESLRQQLAECQAREKMRQESIDDDPLSFTFLDEMDKVRDLPSGSTALDIPDVIRQRRWQREALLEAADWCKEDSERLEGAHDFDYAIGMNIAEDKLRSMAKELE